MNGYEVADLWIANDPNPQTRTQLSHLIADARGGDLAAQVELTEAFSDNLRFGTAGLRARMGPGPNRMNTAVVRRTSAGLAHFILDNAGTRAVVGFDARTNSEQFAHDTAAVMSAAGLTVFVLPRPLPTPVLAFAVRELIADVGVMITASHNPAQDNGYKVYLASGSQIATPIDQQIEHYIEQVGAARSIAVSDSWATVDDAIVEHYLDIAAGLYAQQVPRDLHVLYTPLHGVGGQLFAQTCRRIGILELTVVAEQFDPNAHFPTVEFPNPEEPGAMDAALTLASEVAPDVVIAHDPDADRCAVAINRSSQYEMLSGDEVGALLGWWAVERTRCGFGAPLAGTMATTIVSSSLLELIAQECDLDFRRCLTGFKYLGAIDGLVYAYEEALGYCVDPEHVRDKDGLTAAVRVLELAAWLKSQGRTIDEVLIDIDREFGVHLTRQISVRMSALQDVNALMVALRMNPPRLVAGQPVSEVVDLAVGWNGLPATDAVLWRLPNARVIIRPSGTEPKLKAYLELVREPQSDVASSRHNANDAMVTMCDDVAGFLNSLAH